MNLALKNLASSTDCHKFTSFTWVRYDKSRLIRPEMIQTNPRDALTKYLVVTVILTNRGCNSVQSSEYRLISDGTARIKYDGLLNGKSFLLLSLFIFLS